MRDLSVTLFLSYMMDTEARWEREGFSCSECGNFLPPSVSPFFLPFSFSLFLPSFSLSKTLPHLHDTKQKRHELRDSEVLLVKRAGVSDTTQEGARDSCFASQVIQDREDKFWRYYV